MGTIATADKDDFSTNRCKSVAKILWGIIVTWLAPIIAKILWGIIVTWLAPINKGFLTTSKPNTTIRTL